MEHKYGFYRIDNEYLKFLNSKDTEVFYKNETGYDKKPHLGIITQINDMEYCIPLTSAKPKHLNWANMSNHNLIIFEIVKRSDLQPNDVYKQIDSLDQYKRIIAVLEIKKMIPVNRDLYTYINFDHIQDLQYRNLLEKEYLFLKPYKDKIIEKALQLYNKQMQTNRIQMYGCDFKVCECAYQEYLLNTRCESTTEDS